MIKRPASRLHVMVRHKMVHMVRRTGAVTRAENGIFTSAAETEISTSGAAGRKNFANLVRRQAVTRSGDRLSAIEAGEKQVMFTLEEAPVSERRTKAMLKEIVRRAVAEMINHHEVPLPEEESVALVDGFRRQRGQIGRAQRTGDWSPAAELAGSTAEATSVPLPSLNDPIIAREILAMMRHIIGVCVCPNPILAGFHDVAATSAKK